MRSYLFVAALGAVSLSCGSSSSNADAPADVPIGITDTTMRIVLEKHEIPPGDSFECFYTDLKTDREIFVNGAVGKQGPGGHHITIYYTVAPQEPGHHKCDDMEMTNWRQVGGIAGGNDESAKQGVIDLPPGVAMKVPKGQQIVVQTHYINATSQSREVEDDVTVKLLRPEEVKTFANAYVVADTQFKIPPQSTFTRTATCTVDKDLDLVLIMGHMHEWGAHYKLERLDDQGKSLDTFFDIDWDPSYASHPPTTRWSPDAPYHLAKGSRLRQSCTWKNNTPDGMRFPREMCVVFSYYLNDTGFLTCEPVADAN